MHIMRSLDLKEKENTCASVSCNLGIYSIRCIHISYGNTIHLLYVNILFFPIDTIVPIFAAPMSVCCKSCETEERSPPRDFASSIIATKLEN